LLTSEGVVTPENLGCEGSLGSSHFELRIETVASGEYRHLTIIIFSVIKF